MMKRTISLLLMLTMLVWMTPAAGAFAQDEQADRGSSDGSLPEAVAGQVVVLYEDDAVDTNAPAAGAEKNRAKKVRRAESFGEAMDDVAGEDSGEGDDGAAKAENTLGQQAEILSESLGNDFVIEETVVLGADAEAQQDASETVVSTVSSDRYSAEELVEKLSSNENIAAAEPNYIFHMTAMPDWNDTYLQDSWQNTEKGISADLAWANEDFDRAEDPVIIAVMDTGIDFMHEDLADRMWTEPEGFKLKGEHGMDFYEKDETPFDENGHGTHCAGIIAAAADNGKGVVGAAGSSQKIQLMSVRVLDEEGSGTFEDIISAFYYLIRAKNAGADIRAVNCSFGANVTSEIFDKVIDKVGEAGILTIASAGNEMADNDEVPSTPANCRSEYVISVAALDDNGELASYSNYGRRNVDVAAPGSNILSTVSYNNYTPYLYDNETLGLTTEYYGEFEGSAVFESTDAAGNTVQSITPVTGTDYFGNEITTVSPFGESVMIQDLAAGSKGRASLELVNGENDVFPVGNNKTSLRWNITNARAGDKYVLYFPYEKMATGANDTYMSMVFRTYTDARGGYGELDHGDIITYVDKNGKLAYRTVATEEWFGYVLPVSEDWNSIWQASGRLDGLFPHTEIRSHGADGAEAGTADEGSGEAASPESQSGYGLGMIYTAMDDGDIHVDISSLAVGKVGADEQLFGKYDVYSGTSMATPVVAGAAGLIASMAPELSAAELRDKLFVTTSDGYFDVCSTGGAVDFSEYTNISSAEMAKPVISDASCDFDAKTVTLTAKNFGQEPSVIAYFNFTDEDKEIAAEDISLTDSGLVISDNYGLIGSQVTFFIENTGNGRTGSRTFYLVKGLKSYDELFTVKTQLEEEDFFDWDKGASARDMDDEDDEEEEPTLPGGLRFIRGADRYLLYDNSAVYVLAKNKAGKFKTYQLGETIEETIDKYAAKMAKTSDLWAPDDPEKIAESQNTGEDQSDNGDADEEETGYYTSQIVGEPVCIGSMVYALVNVDLTDREANLILALDTANGNKWSVYYDSLSDFGTAPAGFRYSRLYEPTVAVYDGRIYVFDDYDIDEEGEPASNTRVYSCTLSAKGSKWEQAEDMCAPVTGGKALAQGGCLYYFFGSQNNGEFDYNIYKFDGSEWTEAGELPVAIYKGGEGVSETDMFFGIESEDDLSCAYGIDDAGIIFAGRSFDGVGDTFRFNTASGELEQLGYTLWGEAADRITDGTVAGDNLIVWYTIEDGEKTVAKTMPIKSGYYQVKVSKTGKGSGTVTGTGSFPKGEKSHIVITPAKGSYVYQIKTSGLSPNFSKKYGKPTKTSKAAFSTDFAGKGNASISIHFGKISTKLTVKKVKTVKVGKRKLKAYTNGTVSGVKWKSSKKKYARVNKNGTITFRKAGKGKTVKLTATSIDNPKLKKTIKVKIKK